MNLIYIKLIRYTLNFFDYFQQKKIINFFKKRLNDDLIFFDIGAHYGETINLFKKNLKVREFHCFEPSFDNFKRLKKNFNKQNDKFIVKLNNFALGEYNQILNLNYTKETSSSSINDFNFNSSYLKKKLSILNIKINNNYFKKEKISVKKLDDYFSENKLKKIDILKIDTEGYELSVLKGFSQNIHLISYIYFEHHFDDMIKKNYNLSDIHNFLTRNNFEKKFKIKMHFRKSFEYIYQNNRKIS